MPLKRELPMPRVRLIKPEFFDDPDIGALSPTTALLFIGLWTQADREGRMLDDPRRVKTRLVPYWPVNAEAALAELCKAGFIIRYQDSHGRNLLQIRSFAKHQHVHPREAVSVYEAPALKLPGQPGNLPASPSASTSTSTSTSLSTSVSTSGDDVSGVPPAREPRTAENDDAPQPAAVVASEPPPAFDVEFRTFVAAYPPRGRTVSRMAEELFVKARLSGVPFEDMLAALENHCASEPWQQGKVPNLIRWLEESRWHLHYDPPRAFGVTAKTAGNVEAIQQVIRRRLHAE
jgi:hypothetical protein